MQNSGWEHALERAQLNSQQKQQHRAIIRWFLGYCRKRQPPAAPGRNLANEFDRRVLRNRNPSPALLAQWRAGLRWLLEFLGEPSRPNATLGVREPGAREPVTEPAQIVAFDSPGVETGAPVCGEPAAVEKGQPVKPSAGNQAWRLTMIGQARLKHLSYRTEQTYLEWVSRFAGFLKGRNPLTATDEDAVGFLSDLAIRKQVAGSTQNQAFNALLFFFR